MLFIGTLLSLRLIGDGELVGLIRVVEEGFEPPQGNTGHSQSQGESGAESGSLGAREASFDPDLAAVIDAPRT